MRDSASKNGTRVNGQAVAFHVLQGDEWLDLGGVLAYFCVQSSAARAAATQRDTARRDLSRAAGEQLAGITNAGALLDSLLDAVLDLAGTRRAFLMLETDFHDFEVLAARGISAGAFQSAAFVGSVSVLDEVARTESAIVSCDAIAHPRFGERPSIAGGRVRALMCVPVRVNDRRRAILYTDSDEMGKVFDELDMEMLENLAERTGVAIAASLLKKSLRELSAELAESPPAVTLSRLLDRHAGMVTAGA